MRLIFIRHPQTQANVSRLIYGRTQSDYSPAGRATIPGIVKALEDVRIDVLISSPLLRTRYLAEQIAVDHGLDREAIHIDDRVIEVHCGVLENKSREEALANHEAEYKALMADYENYVIPGGESFQMVYERAVAFLQQLYGDYEAPRQKAIEEQGGAKEGIDNTIDNTKEKTVVVVAHSAVIHAALAYLLKIKLKDIWHIKVEPGAVVDLDYRYEFAMLQSLSGPFNIRAAK